MPLTDIINRLITLIPTGSQAGKPQTGQENTKTIRQSCNWLYRAVEKVPPQSLRLPRDSANRLLGAKLAMTLKWAFCHCEEHSDEAISPFSTTPSQRFKRGFGVLKMARTAPRWQ
ncbi:MAG: hypothetical protein CEE38_10620 [Planctomycetes bacterium B3_Pla]|nr:MAG: hypothetical protein CEE38_10620 [Planctomycetes bacterium B3_Pla]